MKFHKTINGVKFYCDEKGVLTLKDGVPEAVADGEETVDVEADAEEVTKLLGDAMKKAIETGDRAAALSIEKTMEAVTAFFDAVEEKAKGRTSKVELEESTASFNVEDVEKGLAGLKKDKGSFSFSFKSLGDLNHLVKSQDRGDITITAGPHIEPQTDPSIDRAPVRSTFLENIADVGPIDSDHVKFTEVTGASGAPASTSELGTIPQKDYTFQVYTKPVQKVAVINKHSVELLNYAPELVSAIKSMLHEDLNIVVDGQLLSGNGTPPQLQGILGVAEELDATAIGTQEIADPNLFDILRIAYTKIVVAGKGKFLPNYVILNPVDAEELDLVKDADGRYVLPPFFSANGATVKGVRVLENTGITAGSFLMGDFRYLKVRTKGGVEVEITNSDSDDFQKDLIAIKLRRFLVSYVKNNHSGAFMFGDISDIKAALTPAS